MCRADNKRIERDMVASGNYGYGVFLWRGDGNYHIPKFDDGVNGLVGHLKLFKRKSAAEKLCAKLNAASSNQCVVRLVKNV
jgi:hypothetical protein